MTETTSLEIVSGPPGQSRQLTSAESAGDQSEFFALIERLATNPAVDVAKLSSILDLQERLRARQGEAEFNRAFHEMEPKIPRIKKDGTVEYKGAKAFKFATWQAIDAIIRPILREHGFSLSFQTSQRPGDGGGIVVTGTLLHVAGHSRSASIPLALDSSGGKNAIQGMGSTFSYGARYTARMLLNIVTDDDDDGVLGGMRFISAEQVAELDELIERTKSDRGKYLQILGVARLENIEAGAWAAARNMLRAKVKE